MSTTHHTTRSTTRRSRAARVATVVGAAAVAATVTAGPAVAKPDWGTTHHRSTSEVGAAADKNTVPAGFGQPPASPPVTEPHTEAADGVDAAPIAIGFIAGVAITIAGATAVTSRTSRRKNTPRPA
jgi:hypothetical protein